MLWCLPFVLNQSIDTLYKRVPFYQTKNVTVLLDQTIKETRVQKLAIAQPAAWPYSSIQLKVSVITSPEIHLKKKGYLWALQVWTIGAIAQSCGKCKMKEESYPLISFKIGLNFKAKPICKSYFVTTCFVWNDIDLW